MRDRSQVIADCALLREQVLNCTKQEKAIAEADRELSVTAALVAASVKENATTVQEQEEYGRRFAELERRYNAQKAKKDALQAEIQSKKERAQCLGDFMRTLANNDLILENWDEQLWLTLIENGTVLPDGSINFLFKNGTEILATL